MKERQLSAVRMKEYCRYYAQWVTKDQIWRPPGKKSTGFRKRRKRLTYRRIKIPLVSEFSLIKTMKSFPKVGAPREWEHIPSLLPCQKRGRYIQPWMFHMVKQHSSSWGEIKTIWDMQGLRIYQTLTISEKHYSIIIEMKNKFKKLWWSQ